MELYDQKCITYYGAVNSFELNKPAIELMQNRFKNGIKDVAEFLLKLPLEKMM